MSDCMASIWPNLIKVPPISSMAARNRVGPEILSPGTLCARAGHLTKRWCKVWSTKWRTAMRKISLNRYRVALALIAPPLENIAEEDGPAPRQHVVYGLLHSCPHFAADGPHDGAIISSPRWILVHLNRRQKLGVPFGRQGHRNQREGWCNGDERPIRIPRPEARFDFAENGKYLSASHRNKWNNRSPVTQRQLHECIASKRLQFICLPVRSECAMNPFRKNAQQFTAFQHPVGALLARDHSAQFGHEVCQEREFQQSGMCKKSRVPSGFFHYGMQRHHAIERHEAAMHAHQYAAPACWDMLHAFVFNAPVKLA